MRAIPKWRPLTWVILLVNAIALAYVVGSAVTAPAPQGDAEEIGTAIGIAALIALWVAADIILGIIWLVTKPRRRHCPRCGYDVKRGKTVCRKCGFDFAAVTQQPTSQRSERFPP